MLPPKTCQTCHYFEETHSMCIRRPILTETGPEFELRMSDTPACWLGYCRKPEPGEVTEIFEKTAISRDWEEREPIQSVLPFLRSQIHLEPLGVVG